MPQGGGWCGKELPIFDGDRKKSKDFMDDFDLYIGLNKGMVQASNPSQHIYMCLNLVRGEKVKEWRAAQMAKVACMVTQLGFMHDDEEIWDDFQSEFLDAWSDASKKPDALFCLQNI
jgi:hypothetical protein